MSGSGLHARYEDLLRTHVPALRDLDQLLGTEELAHFGLDSLRTMSLLVALEDAFGVSFPEELLTKSTFRTPDTLWSALAGLTTERHTPGGTR
ncbi:acyl carrier protein [Streptomyces sp. WAC07149]|uniref:phosphopantetheine-binding protein n=1 Tax=Streptomyces sp. WAC07149 TaxID=2487425 RepID=UPI000F7676C7|nr:phosphopantetheine-binding protein [Streptomyces sp. WAC07149]RST08709.1 acyl carrier protein [Streptomyces sp. WAC07149]